MKATRAGACVLAVAMAGFPLLSNKPGDDREPHDSSSASTWTPPRIDEAHEAVGAFTYAGNKRVQIIEVVWGVNGLDNIGLAVFRAVGEDGPVYDYDHPENYKRIAFSTHELHGAYLQTEDGPRILVDELCYTLTPDGFLTLLSLSGATEFDGTSVRYFQQQLPYCCQPVSRQECVNSGGCTGTCGSVGNCVCMPGGGGGCTIGTFMICAGKCGGVCPGSTNESCHQTSSAPIACGCD